MTIEFTVLGKAQPAGSKKAFALKSGGAYTGRVVVTDDAKHSRSWKQEVAGEARRAMAGNSMLLQAVHLEVTFYVRRPTGHYGTGANANRVKASAPAYPAVKPDLTKLVRAIEDAMTGIVWRDDALIVRQVLSKQYDELERVEIKAFAAPHTGPQKPVRQQQKVLSLDLGDSRFLQPF